jgi:hypothetical protein
MASSRGVGRRASADQHEVFRAEADQPASDRQRQTAESAS